MSSLQKAITLHRAGKLTEAEQAYRAVLAQRPRHADALSLLGVVLEALGKPEEAVILIRKALMLDPKAPLFRLHLGNALMSSGKPAEAAAELRLAARMQPNLPEAHYNLGNALRQSGDDAGALTAYRNCLRLAPDFHLARNNYALLLSAQGEHDAALAELRAVAAADPGNILAFINIANAADEAGRYEESMEAAQKAAALNANHADAVFALGLASMRLGKEAEAVAIFQRAVTLAPGNYGAWDNYAQALQACDRLDEAEAAYHKARTLKPDDPDVNYHIALFNLLRGRLKEGFAAYDWRFRAVKNLKRLSHNHAPLWDGSNPAGKSILVADEQGFGDSIMFCRYLPLLRDRGAKVTYACRHALLPLLQGWDGAARIIPIEAAAQTECDAHISLLDLPGCFKTDTDTIPAGVPYLSAPPGVIPEVLAAERNLRVGLVWRGNRLHRHDHRRSIAFDDFAALLGVAGVRYFSLLRPDDLHGGEAARLPDRGIVDLGGTIGNFADTARLIDALDLIISVDTAAAHLAGALGKPVWLLLPTGPDWRWQTGREDSPWYPGITLYRQNVPNEWGDILKKIRSDLDRLASRQ